MKKNILVRGLVQSMEQYGEMLNCIKTLQAPL